MNGYVCFYKGKKFEVAADTTYSAQIICAQEHNIKDKDRHKITVVLAEKNGKQVTHKPLF